MVEHDQLLRSLNERRRIRRQIRNWSESVRSTAPLSRASVHRAVHHLYRAMAMEAPRVFFCQSPLQALASSLVLQIVLRSAGLRRKIPELAEKSRSVFWRNLWLNLIEQLPAMDSIDRSEPGLWLSFTKSVDDRYAPVENQFTRNSAERDDMWSELRANPAALNLTTSIIRQMHSHFHFVKDLRVTSYQLMYQIPARERQRVFEEIWNCDFRPPGGYENGLQLRFENYLLLGLELFWGNWRLSPSFLEHTLVTPIGCEERHETIAIWSDLLQQACCYIFFDQVCFVSDRPRTLNFDSEYRLHSESEAAIQFEDGYALYSWHGTTVPPAVVLNPQAITVQTIEEQTNAEVRRCMLERFGEARYIEESFAQVVDSDRFGTLYRKALADDEPLTMVRVKNSTPETDGSFRTYFIRVPPDTESARAAVAWTFGLPENDYAPQVET